MQVPGEVSLAVLHEVVQSVMGWSNSHLHEFDIAGRRFGMPDPGWDDPDLTDDRDLTDEAKGKKFQATLADPKHPDHDERLEWAGGPFDPHRFDLDETDGALEWLAWRPLTPVS